MNMQDFHCEMLELSFWFSSEDMDEGAFLKAVGIESKEEHVDEDGDLAVALNFAPRKEDTNYHAHMRIWFFNDGQNRIDISYHDSRAEEEPDSKPPSVEDLMQWLGGFFRVDKIKARRSCSYTFGKTFSPVVSLPFPLVSSEKALAGSLVTGLSILFPKETPETATIQTTPNDEIVLFFTTSSELNFRDFDLLKELQKLADSVNTLVRQEGNSHENRKDRR